MKSKPPGIQYRNLYVYRGSIWYERQFQGKRLRTDLETSAWGLAAERRDAYEAEHKIPAHRSRESVPARRTLAELTDEYMEGALGKHKPATVTGKRTHARQIKAAFGDMTPADLSVSDLISWWESFVVNGGRQARGANAYVKTLSQILKRARAPRAALEEFRSGYLHDYFQLSSVRAESRDEPNPVESDAGLSKVLGYARETGLHHYAFVLCMLDAGMRPSEILALRESDLVLGADGNDAKRSIHVQRGISAGVAVDTTKSGRSRHVQMSRRLRRVLMEVKLVNGPRPVTEPMLGHALPGKSGKISETYWRRWAARAGISGHVLYNLRASYASRLITAGFPMAFVASQIGDRIGTCEKHYGKWMPSATGGMWVAPEPLDAGEVPADVIAKRVPFPGTVANVAAEMV